MQIADKIAGIDTYTIALCAMLVVMGIMVVTVVLVMGRIEQLRGELKAMRDRVSTETPALKERLTNTERKLAAIEHREGV